ncbi:hypothetical protein ACLOJK_026602 [Asimina triloba]
MPSLKKMKEPRELNLSSTLLRVVFQGVAGHDTFKNLKTIKIYDCNKLKYLFRAEMLKNFQNLETLKLVRCGGMVDVVSDDEDCPKLEKISLSISNTSCAGFAEITEERAWWDDPSTKELLPCFKEKKIVQVEEQVEMDQLDE